MCDALYEIMSDEFEEAKRQGKLEGRFQGENTKLISLICRKLRKSKTSEIIALELDEDISIVEKICSIAAAFAPDYDEDKIFNAYTAAQGD